MENKYLSRKFLFTLFWCSLIPFGIAYSLITGNELSYMGQVITFAGTCTASYVAIQGYADSKGK
jgi:hypothetical protein